MVLRGTRPKGEAFERALTGTLYWTLSLYVEPDRVASALGLKAGRYVTPDIFRRTQMRHRPSFALRNAIDPLMNDIADRETQGEVQEYLLAATAENPDSLEDASALIRRHDDLIFTLPSSTSWTTEGVRFHVHPPGLGDDRLVRLRRFWFAHNNGALSYHLSFSHYYGQYEDADGTVRDGYEPATYYFLSLLQKLGAPKEYALGDAWLARLQADPDAAITLFDDNLGIDPLDRIKVYRRGKPEQAQAFWPFVRQQFREDARIIVPRIAGNYQPAVQVTPGYDENLLEFAPFIEVPGLKAPKSRFMFMLHDERFFDRLMPLHPGTGEGLPRKHMVQEACYQPYQAKIEALTRSSGDKAPSAVHLGPPEESIGPGEVADAGYWDWVRDRDDYARMLAAGGFAHAPQGDAERGTVIAPDGTADLAAAMRAGECCQIRFGEAFEKGPPVVHHIPAFETGRRDCLDYLFLAGFNQNIIDFMNQDTSEILDSIDPIYPSSDEQSDERFFIRYANHRAMVTYVPRSRSLETGNDYIGTCPYAFLIHVLALHNEFLARRHEERSLLRIERIERLIAEGEGEGAQPAPTGAAAALDRTEPLPAKDPFDKAEIAINKAKLAEFREYERFRYANPFRYDTERDVFKKLEKLRGIQRKKEALALAIKSMEDHASDLQRRQQQDAEKSAAKRGTMLNILLGGTGLFGAGQMIYWIGESSAGDPYTYRPTPAEPVVIDLPLLPKIVLEGQRIMDVTEAVMLVALPLFGALLLVVLTDWLIWSWFRDTPPGRFLTRAIHAVSPARWFMGRKR